MGKKDKDKPVEGSETTRRSVEEWASELGTPAWALAAARMKHAWPEGRQLSRAEFERAVVAARNEVIR
jgi:hypothetical protein